MSRKPRDDLFTGLGDEPARPFPGSRPEPSKAAIDSIDDLDLSRMKWQVYRFIWEQKTYGAIDDEIYRGLNMRQNTARPRRNDLMNQGYIVDSGKRRQTRSGREAIIWIAACFAKPK